MAKLRSELRLIDLFALTFGTVIGWGVFTLVGVWLDMSGPWGIVVAAFVGMLMILPTAISYSILIRLQPDPGGVFTWTYNSFGYLLGFVNGWWLYTVYFSIMVLNSTAFSVWLQLIAPDLIKWGYLYTMKNYDVYIGYVLSTVSILTLFFILNYFGIKFSAMSQRIMTLTLVATGYIYVITCFLRGNIMNTLTPSPWSIKNGLYGVLMWLAIAPWAYTGFSSVAQVIDETSEDPRKITLIIVVTLVIGASFYVLIPLATAATEPWIRFAGMWLVTASVAEKVLGRLGKAIIFLGVLMGVLSGVNGYMIASSRLLFAMGRKVVSEFFSHIHPKYNTPSRALLFTFSLAIPFIFLGREILIWFVNTASFGTAITNIFAGFSLYKIGILKKHRILGLLSGFIGILFIVIQLIQLDIVSIIFIILFTLLGVTLYSVFNHTKETIS
ncbi:MAG: APC family permease [Sulfolobales archaeon]